MALRGQMWSPFCILLIFRKRNDLWNNLQRLVAGDDQLSGYVAVDPCFDIELL
jgi:hypothetical protein